MRPTVSDIRFTVVIPTHGRPERLRACLDGLAALDFSRDEFEVIVVDDGSPLPLDHIVEAFDDHLNITLLRQEKSGPAMARNQGAIHAQGQWIAFVDDDCVPHRDWLARIEAAVGSSETMLGGAAINAYSDNIFAATNQFLVDYVTEWFRINAASLYFFPSNNMIVHAGKFRAIGGFDRRFPLAGGEDREFCARWLGAGWKLASLPAAKIAHYHRQSLGTFLRTHCRYGRGAARLHASAKTNPLKIATWKLHKDLFRAALRSSDLGFRGASLLMVAQASQAVGYIIESLASPPAESPIGETTVSRRYTRDPVS